MSKTTLTFLYVGLTGIVCALLFSMVGTPVHPPLQPPAPDRLRPAMVIVGHMMTVIGAVGVVANAAWQNRGQTGFSPMPAVHGQVAKGNGFRQIQTLTTR